MRRSIRRCVNVALMLAIAAVAASRSASAGQVWYVNAQAPAGGDGLAWLTAFNSLSDALSAAQPADQVWVAAGVYVGNFVLPAEVALYGGFAGDETELAQRNWNTHRTVLDGDASGSVVTVATYATAVTRVDGFVICNGSGTQLGGGTSGGGVYCLNGAPTICNNTITNNVATTGGGVYCLSGAPTIINNTVANNVAEAAGGIFYKGVAVLANNVIVGNGHGGVTCSRAGLLVNNTIAGNSLAGLEIGDHLSHLTCENNLIAFNEWGVLCTGQLGVFRHNCVAENGHDYGGFPDPTGTDGNISIDPGVADAGYGNFHLQPDSPCRDAGDDTVVDPNWVDRDGQPRVLDAHVDIGADEADGTVWAAGPYAVVRVSPTGDDAHNGSTWALAKRSVRSAITTAMEVGGEVWVQAGEYPETLVVPAFVYLYGGFAGTELTRDERDWASNLAALVGTSAEPVVSLHAGWKVSTLNGFTVREGGGDGVNCTTALAIVNNVISGHAGSGVLLEGDHGEVRGNLVTQNGDAGILVRWAYAALIVDNQVRGNHGDGIMLDDADMTAVENNDISENEHYGVNVWGESFWSDTPVIEGNRIAGNGAGGVYCRDTEAVISSNRIERNGVWGYEGGIYCEDGSASIIENTIVDNDGCGINCMWGAPVILANSIGRNRSGGIACLWGDVIIAQNLIRCNSGGWGGGVCCSNTDSLTVVNNAIIGNSGEESGGLYFSSGGAALLANNSFIGNGGWGGAMLIEGGGAPTIANSLIAYNSAGIRVEGSGSPTLRHNCAFGNRAGNYVGIADPTGIDGNIAEDPQLADFAFGNAHLQPGSPCIDAGTLEVVAPDWLDFDEQSRVAGAGVDIGADEADGTVWAAGPYAVMHVSPAGDDANDGARWAAAKRTVQAAVDAGADVGAEVWVQGGTYVERVTLRPYAHVYGGFAGDESEREQRDLKNQATTVDADAAGTAVRVLAGEGASRLDGLTLRNGTGSGIWSSSSGRYGGGVNCAYASPVIVNASITDNSAQHGGGVYCDHSGAQFINCIFAGNRADIGGALCSRNAAPVLTDCVLVGNRAMLGAAILSSSSVPWPAMPRFTGCSIVANTGYVFASVALNDSAVLANTIVAFNNAGISARSNSAIEYNCVYGHTYGNYSGIPDPTGSDGNISADPLFVRMPSDGGDGWGDDPNTPDMDEGANDDFGDLRLRPGSPCVDAGNNAIVPSDAPDLDGDGDTDEALPLDFAGGARFDDDPFTPDTGSGTAPLVDIGAYELQVLTGDLNCDGLVDYRDINRFVLILSDPAAYAAACPACPTANADANGDGSVGFGDINPFVNLLMRAR